MGGDVPLWIGSMKAGVAGVVITPPISTMMVGYGNEGALAKAMDERFCDEDHRTREIDSRLEELAALRPLLWFEEQRVAAISAEIQVLKIDDLVILGIPGELYAEIGLNIKKHSPSKNTIISTVTNDYIGYIPTEEVFGRNPVPSMLGFSPEIPVIIEGAALKAIETLY
jgi:hypothetical protein